MKIIFRVIFLIIILLSVFIGCSKKEATNENITGKSINEFIKVGIHRIRISAIYLYENNDSSKQIRVYTTLGDGEYFITFNSDEEYKSTLKELDGKLLK